MRRRFSTLVAFELRGWELLVAAVPEHIQPRLSEGARHVTRLSDGRFALELGGDAQPERVVSELAAEGVRVIALNPIRATLEDVFVRKVGESEPRDTMGV
ncbi:MAG: DUF4162 domain-containing protein [Acidobacteria bacterium]|nr:DUF4162 domain-containing protein [Acidobacteriota bacterium]